MGFFCWKDKRNKKIKLFSVQFHSILYVDIASLFFENSSIHMDLMAETGIAIWYPYGSYGQNGIDKYACAI